MVFFQPELCFSNRSLQGEAATVSDVTGVAEDDLAGQAIIDVLQVSLNAYSQALSAKLW